MKLSATFFLSVILCAAACAQTTVTSPDGRLRITVSGGKELRVSAEFKGAVLMDPSVIGLDILGYVEDWRINKSRLLSIDQKIIPVVPEKRSEIRDHYRELKVDFRGGIAMQVRAYNDGFAYRFVTSVKDSITIKDELADFVVSNSEQFYGSAVNKRADADIFHTSFEEPYEILATDSISADKLFFSPVLITYGDNVKMVITESDLEDYPGMFLRSGSPGKLNGVYAGYPLQTIMTDGEFPQEIVTSRADFIARTNGRRSFPWRVFLVSEKDTQLPSNDMVYRLASPSRVKETNWIKPGKGTDEWIIGVNLFNVPFKSGVNTATYKFYIDWAKRFGFDRIMMDAGWSDYKDLFKINPDISMDEISTYAKAKGISLSMWTLASTLDRQLEPALMQFKKWGVDFIMTDFMDRDDQVMVNFYHRVARACADAGIMVMFHGGFKPAGFGRTWPNAVTREGVLGSEYNIWSDKAHPDHNLLLPFIRMTAGPMDYEPGLLDNATKETFRPIQNKVMSMGTRMHQAAMFVVYESPIQIFSGNPSQGLLEPAFMEMIGSIPTVWDETIILDGKLGEYIIVARKRGDVWYVAGMTNWTPRSLDVNFSFLNGSSSLRGAIDGANADRYASDYNIIEKRVEPTTRETVWLAPGGGFVMILQAD